MIKIFWVYPGLYALQALKALIPLLNITDKLKKKTGHQTAEISN